MDQVTPGLFQPLRGSLPSEPALIVHADVGRHDHVLWGKCDFFEKIGLAANDRGIATHLVLSDSRDSTELLDGPHKHITFGPKRIKGPNIFHGFPTYIKGFWYLDPKGYFWNSSMMTKPFDPASVDPDAAADFFGRISRWRIRNNLSQRKQAAAAPLAPAEVAIFTQDIERYSDNVHYLITQRMIRAAANAVKGLCYVKPHPLLSDAQRAWLGKVCGRLPNVAIVDASVHDIIRASGVIVSQNSAVGFEALMHRKPVITCAETDYAVASLVSRTAADLRDNIRRAPAHFAEFPYEKYFYWFLGQNMLEPQDPAFTSRAMCILYRQ